MPYFLLRLFGSLEGNLLPLAAEDCKVQQVNAIVSVQVGWQITGCEAPDFAAGRAAVGLDFIDTPVVRRVLGHRAGLVAVNIERQVGDERRRSGCAEVEIVGVDIAAGSPA